MNALRSQLSKSVMNIDSQQHHYDRLTSFPEGEWFEPNNKKVQDFQICNELAVLHLVEKRIKPVWHKGSLLGEKISFRYKLDLNYQS